MISSNPLIVVLLGPPGSGKGSQSAKISSHYGLFNFSVGNALRDEIKNKSTLGQKIQGILKAGNLVNDDVVKEIVSSNITSAQHPSGSIVDGYPRTGQQARDLNNLTNSLNGNQVVICLNIAQDLLLERILNRFSCKDCGAIFNKVTKPLKNGKSCDDCGSTDFITRDDDNSSTLINRAKIYYNELTDIQNCYKEDGIQVHNVDASLSEIDVFNLIKNVIDSSAARI